MNPVSAVRIASFNMHNNQIKHPLDWNFSMKLSYMQKKMTPSRITEKIQQKFRTYLILR